MKNNLTDSIYKAWRTGILPLVTALLLLTGCEMDSDMDLPLNVDSNKYTLTSDAGSTQVRIYSTGEWSVRLSEDVEWASINRLNGSGNTPVLFKYGANYGVPRAVDIIFTRGGLEQAVRMTQEGENPILSLEESRIEIFSNPWDLRIGLDNNLREDYKQIRDTIVYSVIPDEDDDETPEPDEEWIENLAVGTDAVTFSTLKNNSPRKRQAAITLTYIDAKEKKHAVTLTVTQATEEACMTFTPYRAKTTRKATTIKAELKHNLGSLLGKVVCTPTYEGASADWIENITLEDKVLSFDVKENDSEGPRSASIAFSLPGTAGLPFSRVLPFPTRRFIRRQELSHRQLLAQFEHLAADQFFREFGIVSRHVRVRVAQDLCQYVDRHPVLHRKAGERMACDVGRQGLIYITDRRDFLQIGVHLRVRRHGKQFASCPACFIPLVFLQQCDRMR